MEGALIHGTIPNPVVQAREIYIPDLHIDNLKIKSRNFH